MGKWVGSDLRITFTSAVPFSGWCARIWCPRTTVRGVACATEPPYFSHCNPETFITTWYIPDTSACSSFIVEFSNHLVWRLSVQHSPGPEWVIKPKKSSPVSWFQMHSLLCTTLSDRLSKVITIIATFCHCSYSSHYSTPLIFYLFFSQLAVTIEPPLQCLGVTISLEDQKDDQIVYPMHWHTDIDYLVFFLL